MNARDDEGDLPLCDKVPIQMTSCSYFYCMSRPLSNSLETALTTSALALWPWEAPIDPPALGFTLSTSRRLSFLLAALSFAVRPTSAVVCAPIAAARILSLTRRRGWRAALHSCAEGACALALGCAVLVISGAVASACRRAE